MLRMMRGFEKGGAGMLGLAGLIDTHGKILLLQFSNLHASW